MSYLVVKIGGAVALDTRLTAALIAELAERPERTILVHGGGRAVNETSRRLGIEPHFVDGIRITDGEEMAVVDMVLAGRVNTELVRLAQRSGVSAIGITGADGELLRGRRIGVPGEASPSAAAGDVSSPSAAPGDASPSPSAAPGDASPSPSAAPGDASPSPSAAPGDASPSPSAAPGDVSSPSAAPGDVSSPSAAPGDVSSPSAAPGDVSSPSAAAGDASPSPSAAPGDGSPSGRTATPHRVRLDALHAVREAGFLPIVASVGIAEDDGGAVNINADDAARAITEELSRSGVPTTLCFLSDIPGVLDKSGRTLATIAGDEIERLIADGVARDGMAAKLRSCRTAVSSGVGRIAIGNYGGAGDLAALLSARRGTSIVAEGERADKRGEEGSSD